MSKRQQVEPIMYGHSATLIDPAEAGSTISWVVRRNRRKSFSSSMVLTDCSRCISWDFDEDGGLEKIDRALRSLQDFRDTLAVGLADVKRRRKRAVKRG